MTLFKQLITVLVINSVLLTLGDLGISMLTARSYLQNQLQISAHNTAHMLAMQLAPAMGRRDLLKTSVMLQAVFDQGYYRQIVLMGANGQVLEKLQRTAVRPSAVPEWFRRLWPMTSQAEHTTLTKGWLIVGSLTVESDADYAYASLWRQANRDVLLGACVLLGMAMLGFLAMGWLTQPLAQLEEAADAVLRREFREISPVPRTREFRRVVEAMNRLTRHVRILIEDLIRQLEEQHNASFQDALTGLANRKAFDRDYLSWQQAEDQWWPAALIILELDQLAELNNRLGTERADQVLVHIAARLRKLQEDHREALIARLQGGRFVVLLPHCERNVAQAVLDYLMSALRLMALTQEDVRVRFYAGMAYATVRDQAADLLPQASKALEMAHANPESGSHVLELAGVIPAFLDAMGNDMAAIKMRMDTLLTSKDVRLYYMPCVDARQHLLHKEILLRLHVDGQVVPAAAFIPLVEQFGWAWRLDFLVLDLVLQYQSDAANLTRPLDCMHINLSPYSLRSEEFMIRLLVRLEESVSLLPFLRFEVNEIAWILAPQAVKQLAHWLNAHGSGLLIDRFAWRQAGLSLLSSLPLQAIKLDAVYALTDAETAEQSTLLQMLLQLMHSMDIQVMVDNIRSEEQWKRLLSLGVDGGQGFWVGEPRELESLSWVDA